MTGKQTFDFLGQFGTDETDIIAIINLFKGVRPPGCPGFAIPAFPGSIPIRGMHYGGKSPVITYVCDHSKCSKMAEGMFALLSCLNQDYIRIGEWEQYFPTKSAKIPNAPKFAETEVEGCPGFILVTNTKNQRRFPLILEADVDYDRKKRVPYTSTCTHSGECDKDTAIKYALALATIREIVPFHLGDDVDLYHQILMYGWAVTMDLKSEISWAEFLLHPEFYPQRRSKFCPPFLMWSPNCLYEYREAQDVMNDVIFEQASGSQGKKRKLDEDSDTREVRLSIPSPSGKGIRFGQAPLMDDDPRAVKIEQADFHGFAMVRMTRTSANGKSLYFTFSQYKETARIISALVHLWVDKGHSPVEIRNALDRALEYIGTD